MRKVLSCLLVAAMLLSFVPAAAASETDGLISIAGSNMTLGNELVQNFMINVSDIDDPASYTGIVTHAGQTSEVQLVKYNTR